MKTCPVIVIGHVDHGKTTLVRALTGIETDRLPEERARGLSIVPGFAFRQFDDVLIDFIDAPGHADFVRAMISGAAGARAALLIIAANEGVCAQTREHIEIAQALGIEASLVAVTKADLLPAGETKARECALRAALSGTRFCTAPFVFCSSVTGLGLEALGKTLSGLAANTNATGGPPATFLPVDRVFTSDGHGTVVTGTLLGQPLTLQDALVLSPSDKSVSVRRMEVRGQNATLATAGERTALNLRGLSADQIRPGDVLHTPGVFAPSLTCDIKFLLFPQFGRSIRHMEEVRAHFGSGYATASLRLYGGKKIDPGTEGFAELRFHAPVCMFAGQRVILRSLSPAETLGGAIVLDPAPPTARSGKALRLATLEAARGGDVSAIAAALAGEHGGVAHLSDISRLACTTSAKARDALATRFLKLSDETFSLLSKVREVEAGYVCALAAHHAAHPLKPLVRRTALADRKIAPALMAAIEARLAAAGQLVLTPLGVAMSSHDAFDNLSPDQQARLESLASALKASGLSPPGRANLIEQTDDIDLLAILIDQGRVIHLTNVSLKQDIVLHADTLAASAEALRLCFPGGTAFTTGEAREALLTSRKFIVPLLEHFDEAGITIRSGDLRYFE